MGRRAELRRQVGNTLSGLLSTRAKITSRASTDRVLIPIALDRRNEADGNYLYYRDQESLVVSGTSDDEGTAVTIDPAFTGVVGGDSVEMWRRNWAPSLINDLINQAIDWSKEAFYERIDPVEKCLSRYDRRIALPALATMVNEVWKRYRIEWQHVISTNSFKETTGLDNVEFDQYDYRYNSPSIRFDVAAAHALTTHYDAAISLTGLQGMTHLEGWFKRSGNDLPSITLSLRDGSSSEFSRTLTLADDEWTYLQLPLGNDVRGLRSVDSARVSIVKQSADNSLSLWINGLWATNHDTIKWVKLDRNVWFLDHEDRAVVLNSIQGEYPFQRGYYAMGSIPVYTVFVVIPWRDPAQLESDDDETTLDSDYIVSRAAQLAYNAVSGGPDTDPQRYRQQSLLWEERARRAYRRLPNLVNVRRLR